MQSGDQALIDRLVAQGYTVQVELDADVTLADTQGKALVFISESVLSDEVEAQLAPIWQLPVPVFCMEPYLYDALRMTGPNSTRSAQSTPSLGGSFGAYCTAASTMPVM